MKKLITLIIILIAVSCNAQDTVKTFTKIYNYGKADKQVWKCHIIKSGNKIDTVYTKIDDIGLKVPAVIGINTKTGEKIYSGDSVMIYTQTKETGEIYFLGSGQAHRDTDIDTTMQKLKEKIEADYKSDLKQFQELQTKILKEESYLEILNYLIEEKKK